MRKQEEKIVEFYKGNYYKDYKFIDGENPPDTYLVDQNKKKKVAIEITSVLDDKEIKRIIKTMEIIDYLKGIQVENGRYVINIGFINMSKDKKEIIGARFLLEDLVKSIIKDFVNNRLCFEKK